MQREQGVSLGVVVEGMIARIGKTLNDVVDVIPNHPQHPTKVLVIFTDKTSTTLEITYPRNA